MQSFEKLGVFYLGKAYDLKAGKQKEDLILYDAKDLVTHAVCVGMTGSGKTGLCISLLEEAVIDGIPAIAVDPKGDLTNMLLAFPELQPADFLPWINQDDARIKGLSAEDYAAKQAELWKNGLASWGQDGERISRFKNAADFTIYTPGSNAGVPLSILRSFATPPAEILEDNELLAERISTTATSLLTLMGVEADPMRSREHILVSTILSEAWRNGRDLDLAALIEQIQNPPVTRIGVMDLDSFYPSGERFKLAMQLNNLLAAPGFSVWLEGEGLDIDRLLYAENGKPRMSIISIAHLGDAERMFFVSLLLNQLLGWMRTQSGTTSLRALFYMDEIFGYFPPVANPPSKGPLLTLLKQARAFGLGIMLATQNPVDLDYKGLSNTGTWFIGRLQTERDKMRVLEGLEGAAASASSKFNIKEADEILAGLGSRVFLMQNVHEDAPEVFQTRWAMSYLRGPLTRDQIKSLTAEKRAQASATSLPTHATAGRQSVRQGAAHAAVGKPSRPILPPDVPQFFAPASRGSRSASVIYEPMVFGAGEVRFVDTKLDVDESRTVACLCAFGEGPRPVQWDEAGEADFGVSDLEAEPAEGAAFEEAPGAAARGKNYDAWAKEFGSWLQRSQTVDLLRSAQTGLISRPGESEREFRIRLQRAAREKRDELMERLRRKYAPKQASLEERLRRAEQAVEREQEQARHEQVQTAFSVGTSILGAIFSRKSSRSLGRASSVARGMSRSVRQSGDIARARETVESIKAQMVELDDEFRAEADAVESSVDALGEELETIAVKPKRADISVEMVSLVWVPRRGGE